MKTKLKGLILGMIIGAMLVPSVSATIATITKNVSYNDIKITLNGKIIEPKDANGDVVEPFIIDGTTYLPVRAVSNAVGLDVNWDANTKTVKLSTKTNSGVNVDNFYQDLKNWIINNGSLNGDYVYFERSADNYGGNSEDMFSVYYWGDTKTLEVCKHSVLDDEYSINYYIYIPETITGKYSFLTSYYYRDTGESLMMTEGVIDGALFSEKYPLDNTTYYGDQTLQNDFMELARLGTYNTLNCFKEFLVKEKIGYTLNDIGFKNF